MLIYLEDGDTVSLRDMFVDVGFNVSDGKLRGADNAVDKFKKNVLGANRYTNKFESSLGKTGRQLDRFKSKTKSAGDGAKNFGRKVLGIATAYVGIKSLTNKFNEWTEAATDQIIAEKKLGSVMKNTKGVTNEQIQGIKNYASKLQGLGVIGDEVALSGVQQLATYQLQSKTLKTLMPGMEDLLAQQKGLNASQQDAVNVGNMVGKVMSGQVGALSRAGINFTKAQEKILKFGSEEEKAATLAEVLKMNVGGVNKSLRETDSGKIKSAANAFGDMEEELGKKVLPLQGRFAAWFETKIPGIQRTLSKFLDLGIEKFDTLTFFVDEKAIPAFKDLASFFKSDVNPRFIEIGGLVKEIADDFMPSLNSSTGNLKEELGFLVTGGLDLTITALTWIKDNSTAVERTVYALAGAWAVQRGILIVLNGAQLVHNGFIMAGAIASGAETAAIYGLIAAEKIQLVWTQGVTAAQWLFNAAMTANPIGVVVVAIGALGAAIYGLIKHWDKVTGAISKAWNWLTKWNKTKADKKTVEVDTKNSRDGYSTSAETKNNNSYRGIRGVGYNASGTDNWRGGWTWVGEKGRELVNLPRGSQILSNSRSENLVRSAFRGGSKANDSTAKTNISNSTTRNAPKITYAPVFKISGNTDSAILQKIEKKSKEVFEQLMKENFHAIALEVE